jgi:hypothetical protein
LDLGGGMDIKELGKRAIKDNVNNKPSNLSNLYNYDPLNCIFSKKNEEDFPAFSKDDAGNFISPVKRQVK